MKLQLETWGHGPQTLLLLHGFTGDRSTWRHLTPHWEEHFTVLAVDLPGHGESPLPSAPGIDGFDRTVRALVDVLEAQGGPCAVLGYSLGARLALALALQAPERISRLVLESGSPGLRRRKARLARRRDDESLASFIESKGLPAFVRRWESQPLFSSLQKLPEPRQDALRARRLAGSPEGYAGALRALGTGVQPSLWSLLPFLRVPTLLLSGALDLKFSALAQQMAAQLPIAWFHRVDGVGHAPHLEAPEAYAEEVCRFLETPWFDAPVVALEHESFVSGLERSRG